MKKNLITIPITELTDLCTRLYISHGMKKDDALIAAEVLVAADIKEIPSHGVLAIKRSLSGLKENRIVATAIEETVVDTPSIFVVDAHGGMGPPVSSRTMKRAIEKAKLHGVSIAVVKDSNHFGIAGYYAEEAAKQDMIGLVMTNTAPLGVPTGGKDVCFGTNPIAFAAPAATKPIFSVDISTTTVTRGAIDIMGRKGNLIPEGLAIDKEGNPAKNPIELLDDMLHRRGGGLMPLGGLLAGHKGYGLAVMVDILSGLLSGGGYGKLLFDTPKSSARVSHFFLAINPAVFRPLDEFKADMDQLLTDLTQTPPLNPQIRVHYPGEKAHDKKMLALKHGVAIARTTFEMLEELAKEENILTSFSVI